MENELMMNVLFDSYKSYDDWGLLLESIFISFPSPVENKISVPGRDGKLDLSEIVSQITYDEREIKLTFSLVGSYEDWHKRSSHIANAIHGKIVKIILDTDPGFYYIGRIVLESEKNDDVFENIVISGTVDPFKYDMEDGTGDWLWDPFSFEDGIIREYRGIIVNGSKTVIVPGRRKRAMPSITCSAPMELSCGKITVNLPVGTTKVYELQLGEGEHELVFRGKGIVSISYRGGSL